MKRLTLFFAMLLTMASISLSPSLMAADDGPSIKFTSKTHEFGTIREQGGDVSCTFEFTNTGTAPLIIVSARASCGCTTPEFPEQPVNPGQKGIVKVTFNPKHQVGEIHKNVTVRTNDKKHKKLVLTFTGVVVP